MTKLYVYPKGGDPFQFTLSERKISLGRSSSNDIPLDDPFCSGHHAYVYPVEESYVIRDISSKNGVFVNGRQIRTETKLKKGDEILVGATSLLFDKESSSNVDITDAPSPSANIKSVMNVDDVLTKHDASTTFRAVPRPIDAKQIKLQERSVAILSEVNQALLIHVPMNELLDQIMDLIVRYLPMDRGVLMRTRGNPAQFKSDVVRINDERLKGQRIQVSQSIIDMSIGQRSSFLFSNVQDDSRFNDHDSVHGMNIKSAMCVPLYGYEEIKGVIYADRISLRERFTDEDLELLTLLANLAAVKIENAEAIDLRMEDARRRQELELAARVQRDFLPRKNPECENFDISGDLISCEEVSGDYYDFIDIDDKRIAVAIADVSGKGMSAALLMAQLRSSLHTQLDPSYNIDRMTEKLNDIVHGSTATDMYITFFYGEINKESGNFSYINAGHTPPILMTKKGEVRRLGSCGFCLGMFSGIDYDVKTMSLEMGDIVLLFTDGITECRNNANEEYSEEKLIKLLKKHSKLPAGKLQDKIFDEVNAFAKDAEKMDDMTLVVVKRVS
jgi:serine phosphatase RsbU (regulator of sigma subunit)/pSer/pThr/pTyr-binding forkhead associated (FHA) protein